MLLLEFFGEFDIAVQFTLVHAKALIVSEKSVAFESPHRFSCWNETVTNNANKRAKKLWVVWVLRPVEGLFCSHHSMPDPRQQVVVVTLFLLKNFDHF